MKDVGRQIEFLGVLLDTVRMIISFDPVKIKARIVEVRELIGTLKKGKDQRETDIRSTCGKLTLARQRCPVWPATSLRYGSTVERENG